MFFSQLPGIHVQLLFPMVLFTLKNPSNLICELVLSRSYMVGVIKNFKNSSSSGALSQCVPTV